ncbi:hypothetical protein BS78_03G167300 [Paspalum vaginatum]|nr:hypothetical protein BS78_03G167300 [Paspalum vaginatum]
MTNGSPTPRSFIPATTTTTTPSPPTCRQNLLNTTAAQTGQVAVASVVATTAATAAAATMATLVTAASVVAASVTATMAVSIAAATTVPLLAAATTAPSVVAAYDGKGGRDEYDDGFGRNYGGGFGRSGDDGTFGRSGYDSGFGRHHGGGFDRGGGEGGFGRGYNRGGSDRYVRHPKLSLPRYNGADDPLLWLNQCDNFFGGHHTMEEEKVWLASLHLDGAAAQWYFQQAREVGMVPWLRCIDLVNLRFRPPIRSNTLGELKELRRNGTVEDYQRQFLALLCRCNRLTPQHQIDLFTAGLGQPLASDVEMQWLANLQTAMSLALAYERRHQESDHAKPTTQSWPPPRARSFPATSGGTSGSQQLALKAPKPEPATKSRFRRLSSEMADKGAKANAIFAPRNSPVTTAAPPREFTSWN